MSRFHKVLLVVLLAGSSALGVAYAGDSGPCTIATKGATPTAKACASGGRRAATKVMKDMVNQAKANGVKFACDGCHKDTETFALKANAPDDYKKLEAAAAKK
jgi:hypothetical protein